MDSVLFSLTSFLFLLFSVGGCFLSVLFLPAPSPSSSAILPGFFSFAPPLFSLFPLFVVPFLLASFPVPAVAFLPTGAAVPVSCVPLLPEDVIAPVSFSLPLPAAFSFSVLLSFLPLQPEAPKPSAAPDVLSLPFSSDHPLDETVPPTHRVMLPCVRISSRFLPSGTNRSCVLASRLLIREKHFFFLFPGFLHYSGLRLFSDQRHGFPYISLFPAPGQSH